MAKTCAFTVVSADSFQYWLPLWLYAVKKAYPDWDARVLVVGALKERVREILALDAFARIDGYEIFEHQFEDCRLVSGSYGALRYLIPKQLLRPYKWAYIGDVDLLVMPCNPPHVKYHARIMKAARCPYSSFRGPYNRPWRAKVHGDNGWRNEYTRIVGGLTMLNVERWVQKTRTARKMYLEIARKQRKRDGFEKRAFGSFREYDEVMMYRIAVLSNLPTPKHKWEMPDGSRFKSQYRGIHVGDFRRKRRYDKKSRMRPYVHQKSLHAFKRLMKDRDWRSILWHCCRATTRVRTPIRNLRRYVK